jgi:hypothetical protein
VDVHSENFCPLLGIEPTPHVVFADDGTYGSSASQRLNQLSYVTQVLTFLFKKAKSNLIPSIRVAETRHIAQNIPLLFEHAEYIGPNVFLHSSQLICVTLPSLALCLATYHYI